MEPSAVRKLVDRLELAMADITNFRRPPPGAVRLDNIPSSTASTPDGRRSFESVSSAAEDSDASFIPNDKEKKRKKNKKLTIGLITLAALITLAILASLLVTLLGQGPKEIYRKRPIIEKHPYDGPDYTKYVKPM